MNPLLRRAISVALISASVGACTTVDATRRAAVSYNRAFDDARNQILLLNILRARDGYPQQFSTISTVTGPMRPEVGLTGGLDNLLLGAAKVFNPAGSFGFRNPGVTITPLETKEFRKGMMSPVTAEFVNHLLAQGWTPAVVENLTTSGLATREPNAPSRGAEQVVKTISLGAGDGIKMLREGAGPGYKVELIGSPKEGADKVTLVVKRAADPCTKRLPTWSDCELSRHQTVFRSPAGMLQFLAKSLEGGTPKNAYFRVIQGGVRPPVDALISTHFKQRAHYIQEHDRHSLETLALLAEIIGFQTTDATLNAGKPAIAVTP